MITTGLPAHLAPELRPLRVAAQRLLDGWPTVLTLREARAAIDGEIARRANTGVDVVRGGNRIAETAPCGATLLVSWCTSHGEDVTWYPSIDAAKASLVKLADENGRAVDEGGMRLDLTPEGCAESYAIVRDRAVAS